MPPDISPSQRRRSPASVLPAGLDSALALPSTMPLGGARPWRVIKLGGTSMASAQAVGRAVSRLVEQAAERPMAVVVSALAGITDRLLARLDQAAGLSVSPRDGGSLHERYLRLLRALADGQAAALATERVESLLARLGDLLAAAHRRGGASGDQRVEVLATGERLAAEIMLGACRGRVAELGAVGVEPRVVDPGEMLVADGALEDAELDLAAVAGRPPCPFPPGQLWVVPGFFARGHDRRVRLLGRGGSDTSATLLGAVLGADRVEIWTDVDGVFARDPRLHAGERPFARLSYEQAERLAVAGARVLHAKSMAPARVAGVPVLVRNSFRPEAPGTWIGETGEGVS